MLDFEQIDHQASYTQGLDSIGDITIQQFVAITREIDSCNQEIARQRAEILELRTALAVQEAGRAGLRAQALALKAELERIDPNNALFAETGKFYKTGIAQNNLKVVYDGAFDKKAQELNLSKPQQFRPAVQ
jgi:hypothetical protein